MNRSASPAPSPIRGASMDTEGVPSSSTSVPVPVAVPTVALTALDSATSTVSSLSSTASPVPATSRVRAVAPGANVRVPGATAV